jgi:hypothetical protein
MKKVKVVWNTDGLDPKEANLPSICEVPSMDDDLVADYLSDTYGFCVESWDEC